MIQWSDSVNLLEFSTVGDADSLGSSSRSRSQILHLPHHIQPVFNAAEHHVLPVQPGKHTTHTLSTSHSLNHRHMKRKRIFSYHSVLTVQMKNWDPFVFGPALAMDRIPGKRNTHNCLTIQISIQLLI